MRRADHLRSRRSHSIQVTTSARLAVGCRWRPPNHVPRLGPQQRRPQRESERCAVERGPDNVGEHRDNFLVVALRTNW